MYDIWLTYVLWSELFIKNVWGNDVTNGVSSVERRIIDGLLGLSSTVCSHPGDKQRVDGINKCNQIVASEESSFVFFLFWKSNK